MVKNKNKDSKQDIAIAELKIVIGNLKERLDTFISNDFQGFKKKIESIEKDTADIKGKMGAYAIIVPLLTGAVGAMAMYILTAL